MIDYFIYDGVDCRDFRVNVFEKNTFGGSAREYATQVIPGRSGEILIDQKRHSNTEHVYSCLIYENAEENLDSLREFLLSRSGYRRLEDTMHRQEFYQAYYAEEFNTTFDRRRSMCKFNLLFRRKPQRYLKEGEDAVEYTSNGKIYNPSRFPSQPLIRVYGTGSFGIAGTTITISANPTHIDIDCEVMEAFTGTTSKNDKVSFSGNDFPTLHEGENGVTLSGNISKVIITPRWYRM